LAFRALGTNNDVTTLRADKGNTTTVLSDTVHYNQNFGAHLQDPAYRRLAKDPNRWSKAKTHFCFKRSILAGIFFPSDYVLTS